MFGQVQRAGRVALLATVSAGLFYNVRQQQQLRLLQQQVRQLQQDQRRSNILAAHRLGTVGNELDPFTSSLITHGEATTSGPDEEKRKTLVGCLQRGFEELASTSPNALAIIHTPLPSSPLRLTQDALNELPSAKRESVLARQQSLKALLDAGKPIWLVCDKQKYDAISPEQRKALDAWLTEYKSLYLHLVDEFPTKLTGATLFWNGNVFQIEATQVDQALEKPEWRLAVQHTESLTPAARNNLSALTKFLTENGVISAIQTSGDNLPEVLMPAPTATTPSICGFRPVR